MQLFGFTLNLLTLLAIVLSVGLVVDDAIVIVENVERHIREGKTPLNAALLGARELVGPGHCHDHHARGGVRADCFSGRLDRFALPRVCAHARRRGVHFRHRGLDALPGDVREPAQSRAWKERGLVGRINHGFDRLRKLYARVLDSTLNARPAVYVIWIGLSLLTVPMLMMAPKELAPTEDQGIIAGHCGGRGRCDD